MSKAQSLTEYALVLTVIGVTMVGLQISFRRNLQAHIKQVTDQFALQEDWTDLTTSFDGTTNAYSISNSGQSGNETVRADTASHVYTWDFTNRSFEESSWSDARVKGY